MEILLRFDPATGGLQVTAPGLPAVMVHLVLDIAKQAAMQQAAKELREKHTVSVPSPDQVKALLMGG